MKILQLKNKIYFANTNQNKGGVAIPIQAMYTQRQEIFLKLKRYIS